jgi:hypothetical protein
LTRLANADLIDTNMLNPRTFVLCRVLRNHTWERIDGDDLDSGWRCRDCNELVLDRYLLERDHEPEVKSPYWGRRQRPPGESKT